METDIKAYLELSEQELLMEIGRLSDPRAPLHSPGELARKGREFVLKNMHMLREQICGKPELVNLPEAELATAVLGVALQHVTLGLAAATAAYVAKRGIKWICSGREDND